ncbi:hypothetical protein [Hymenobacter ruricola]|uniref:Uncharacterized protein n=1 Tax=Hymenobacter ruricola TaxID=2791023 RepID=A0ABS0I489_9BACT|nr:hypothetical protein [Hymenobacter ruricola]MBF9221757.1 hypothetical protein [Hymenobacter ruricola]
MLNQKTSYWLGSLILLLLVLRVGYKYYRSQQRPEYETKLTDIKARVQALSDSIEADQDDQRARGATVVVADSSILAADTAAVVK